MHGLLDPSCMDCCVPPLYDDHIVDSHIVDHIVDSHIFDHIVDGYMLMATFLITTLLMATLLDL